MSTKDTVGATCGVSSTASKEGLRAEQVYVRLQPQVSSSHPVVIDGWVGYGTIGFLRITPQQAMELVPLLIKAAGGSEGDYIKQLREEVARLQAVIEAAKGALNEAAWYKGERVTPGAAS